MPALVGFEGAVGTRPVKSPGFWSSFGGERQTRARGVIQVGRQDSDDCCWVGGEEGLSKERMSHLG